MAKELRDTNGNIVGRIVWDREVFRNDAFRGRRKEEIIAILERAIESYKNQ
jgi:hypothetical protein